jgi:hypothetical protein
MSNCTFGGRERERKKIVEEPKGRGLGFLCIFVHRNEVDYRRA